MIDTMNFWKSQSVFCVTSASLLYVNEDPFEYFNKNGRYMKNVDFLNQGSLDGPKIVLEEMGIMELVLEKKGFYKRIQWFIKNVPLIETVGSEKTKREMLSSISNIMQALTSSDSPSPLQKLKMKREDIQHALKQHNQPLNFFEPSNLNTQSSQPEYMNPNHPRFSPALYAGIKAWEANENNALITNHTIQTNAGHIKANTVKNGSIAWLYQNSESLGIDTKDKTGKRIKVSKTLLEAIALTINPPSQKKGGKPPLGLSN